MTLTHKPFKKIFKEDTLEKMLYHLHRAVELAHKYEKEKNEKKYSLSDPSVCVSPNN